MTADVGDDAELNVRVLLDDSLGPELDVEDLEMIVDEDPGQPWPISGDELAIMRSIPRAAWGAHRWTETERDEYVFYAGTEPTA